MLGHLRLIGYSRTSDGVEFISENTRYEPLSESAHFSPELNNIWITNRIFLHFKVISPMSSAWTLVLNHKLRKVNYAVCVKGLGAIWQIRIWALDEKLFTGYIYFLQYITKVMFHNPSKFKVRIKLFEFDK